MEEQKNNLIPQFGSIPSPRDYRDIALSSVIVPTALPDSYFIDVSTLPIWNQMRNGSCFLPGTIVSLANGDFKEIEKISVGEEVVDVNGRARKVTETMSRKWQGNLYEISTYGTQSVICTPEHPFFTKRGWVSAKDIRTDDYIKIPIRMEKKDKTNNWVERDKDFLKLFGLYLAEGHLDRPKESNGTIRIGWSFHKKEKELHKFVSDTVNNLFGIQVSETISKDSNGTLLRCSSFYLGNLLSDLGSELCDKKRINYRLLSLPPDLQIEILRGWLLGDGTFCRKNIEGVTTSKVLAYQLYDIALRCGLTPSLRLPKVYDGRKPAYIISFASIDNYILFPDKYKKKDGRRLCDFWRGENNNLDNFFRRVYDIRILRANKELEQPWKTVYNLEVEESHSYVVNFMAVHNCVGHATAKYKQKLDLTDAGKLINLSPRFVYSVCKAVDGWSGEGTYPRLSLKVLKDYGCATEETVPNNSSLPHEEYVYYRDINKIPKEAFKEAETAKIESYASVDITPSGIKTAISQSEGCSMLVMVGNEWYTDKNGLNTWDKNRILPIKPPKVIISGHQIYAYGYETVGDDFKIHFINSWSSDWADGGKGWFWWSEYKNFITEAWTAIDIPNELLEQAQNLPSEEEFKYNFKNVITYGQKSEDVRALQTALKILGFFKYPEITGYYGPITAKAVYDFQVKYNVASFWELYFLRGNRVGPKTRAMLNNLFNK